MALYFFGLGLLTVVALALVVLGLDPSTGLKIGLCTGCTRSVTCARRNPGIVACEFYAGRPA